MSVASSGSDPAERFLFLRASSADVGCSFTCGDFIMRVPLVKKAYNRNMTSPKRVPKINQPGVSAPQSARSQEGPDQKKKAALVLPHGASPPVEGMESEIKEKLMKTAPTIRPTFR